LDLEAWWIEHGDGSQLGYSSLLGQLSATPAGRDLLLRGYFEASEEDREQGRKQPTTAHEAIAELVARGSVRVIITTNFDQLLERALEARGIQPQVIHRAEQIAGMTPLTHSVITIFKLHGDYSDLDKLNTEFELETYPEQVDYLLRRIIDEYGLIVCGWSADWDTALVRAFEETKSRRYPLFWTSRGSASKTAMRLMAQIGAAHISGVSADDLFTNLRDGLNALDRLAAPPLSRDMAVTRLKQYLPNPSRKIDIHDLVIDEVKRVERLLSDRSRYPMTSSPMGFEQFDGLLTQCRGDLDSLLHMLAPAAYYGASDQNDLWTRVMDRLLAVQTVHEGGLSALLGLRRYPALLVATTMLAAGSLAEHHDIVGAILIRPRCRVLEDNSEVAAAVGIHSGRVIDDATANALPRWNRKPGEGKFTFPASHLVRSDLDDVLAVYEPRFDRREQAMDHAEYLIALAQLSVPRNIPCMGEFVIRWRYGQTLPPFAQSVREAVLGRDSALMMSLFDGDVDRATRSLDELDVASKATAERRF
jgi:hypothetical protein